LTAKKVIGVICLVVTAALIHGCAKGPPWNSKDISGLMPRLEFNLVDESAQPVSAAAFRGKAILLFFGYTHCPDYCPTTLSRLANVLDDMPNDRSKVRVLFVSVDPRRDNPKNLAIYTNNFASEVIGLTGTEAELRDLAKRYRTTFSYGKENELGNYTVSHGLAVYVFDREGKARLMILQKETEKQIAADLKRLLDESSRE
jgi:protein SCO1/2